ncbi:MAG: hypothetical protein VW683_14765 [Betaproteobacteria bacterium]|jgi:hypothetical protein
MNDNQEERLVRALERIARSLEAVEEIALWLREEVELQRGDTSYHEREE